MPFRVYHSPSIDEIHPLYYRKEQRFAMKNNQNVKSHSIENSLVGRASVLTSAKGSITVEAAMAIPLFLFATVALLYLLEIMAVQTSIRAGMQYAGRQVAEEASYVTVLLPSEVEKNMISAIGAERLERSTIVGGSGGISCGKSRISPRTGIGTICVEYQIRIPIPFYQINKITKTDSMKIKAWTGYEKEGISIADDTTVYITDTGMVYHKDYHCTYLDLSIQMVRKTKIPELRNIDGGKYYACEYCMGTVGNKVYITNSGNRYHSSLACSGLKRTIYAIPLSDALGKGACSRCGK